MSNRSEDHQQYYVKINALTPAEYWAKVAQLGRPVSDLPVGTESTFMRASLSPTLVDFERQYRTQRQIEQRKGAA